MRCEERPHPVLRVSGEVPAELVVDPADRADQVVANVLVAHVQHPPGVEHAGRSCLERAVESEQDVLAVLGGQRATSK